MNDSDEFSNFEADPREGDPELETEAEVACPYCGEPVVLRLDPAGGTSQEYVQDCDVCCQPWLVRVRYEETGHAQVTLEPAT